MKWGREMGVYCDAYSKGVPVDLLKFVGAKSVNIPENEIVSDAAAWGGINWSSVTVYSALVCSERE